MGILGVGQLSQVYTHLSQAAFGRMTSELALRLANPTMSASFRDVRHTSDVRQVAVWSLSRAILRCAIAAELTAELSQSAGI